MNIFKLSEEEKRSNLSAQEKFLEDAEGRRREAAGEAARGEAAAAEEGQALMKDNHERIAQEERRRRSERLRKCGGKSSDPMQEEAFCSK